jgi:Flp pilus assembly protein TadG
MRNMLRCRRGSAAFATVAALVPLIGVVALGAEAGSWYVTKQHAQNAADAAAYSGGLRLACSIAGGSNCDTAQDYVYRGKQFAAQNAFCNAGGTSYPGSQCATSLPTGISQSVQIDQPTSSSVRAIVSQQQPTYLAAVLGLSTVNIGATAIAEVRILANPCVLTLHDPLSFKGSTTVQAQTCGLASNSKANNSLDFTGNGLDVSKVGSISGVGGCANTGGGQCDKAITFAPPVPNPLSGLDSAISSLKKTDFPDGACPAPSATSPILLPAYGAPKKCYYDGSPFQNNKTYTLNGVYFFADGPINIQANTTITGTATLILLPPKFVKGSDPGASLNTTGNPTIQITAPTSVLTTQVPAALASVVNLMGRLLIYDPEPYSNKGVAITGNSTNYLNGITYVPNTPVTYQGSTQSSSCTEVIAYAVTLSGNSNFDNSGCPASATPKSQYVRLMQ